MSRFALPKTALRKPNWKTMSSCTTGIRFIIILIYRADALTAALWCSSHPQMRKHHHMTSLRLACTFTGNSHYSSRPLATNYRRQCNVLSQTAKLANIRLKKTDSGTFANLLKIYKSLSVSFLQHFLLYYYGSCLRHKDMIRIRVLCGHPTWLSRCVLWVVMWGMCVYMCERGYQSR